jgi:hypothetical protein
MAIMESFLDSDDPRLRETALESIAQYAEPEQEYRVRVVLERALSQGSAADRAAVARGLGHRPLGGSLHELIGPLLGRTRHSSRRGGRSGACWFRE